MPDLMATLPDELKERSTNSHYERQAYTHDMSPLEGFITSDWLKALPDLVVLPRTTEEISTLLTWASKHKVPITPRGAGSSSLFQSVPARGGVLLDLNQLNQIGPWDESTREVQVGAGTVIYELMEEAKKKGLAISTFPSSAPVGTFGGWFSNGGRGYGSLIHGSLSSRVRGLEVVLAGGEVRQLDSESHPPAEWFFGAEGTLGVITKMNIQLDAEPEEESHLAFGFPSVNKMQDFLLEAIDGAFRPYNITFVSATLGGEPIRRIHWDALLPGTFLVADFFGSGTEVAQGVQRIKQLKQGHEVHQLPRWQAERFWDERFYNFRLQRTGPSLLGGEVVMPVHRISSYVRGIDRLAKEMRKPMINFGYVTNRQEAYVTTMFWADEARTILYVLDLTLVNAIYRTAFKFGARPVGIGLWNTPYLRHAYSRQERRELWVRKKLLDPQGIINPGKTYRAPYGMLGPSVFATTMLGLRGVRKILNQFGRIQS